MSRKLTSHVEPIQEENDEPDATPKNHHLNPDFVPATHKQGARSPDPQNPGRGKKQISFEKDVIGSTKNLIPGKSKLSGQQYARASSQSNAQLQNKVQFNRQPSGDAGNKYLLEKLDEIDNRPDMSVFSEDEISQLHQNLALENKTVIHKDNKHVRLVLDRIGRLQQIKRLNQDFLDIELFGENFTQKKIKLVDLAAIFMQKLGLKREQAINFTRFLLEDSEQ